jgi:hypothetical protein
MRGESSTGNWLRAWASAMGAKGIGASAIGRPKKPA